LARLPLTLSLLDPETGDLVRAAANGFARQLPPIGGLTTTCYRERVARRLSELKNGGHLLLPPVLLRTGMGYEVLDGTHRLAALVLAQAKRVPVDAVHEAWVADPP
jgi:hypothetical protein